MRNKLSFFLLGMLSLFESLFGGGQPGVYSYFSCLVRAKPKGLFTTDKLTIESSVNNVRRDTVTGIWQVHRSYWFQAGSKIALTDNGTSFQKSELSEEWVLAEKHHVAALENFFIKKQGKCPVLDFEY